MEDMELFHRITNNLIQDYQDKKNISTDIIQDLKRMADLGCFTVYSTDQLPDIKFDGNSVTIEGRTPRLVWTGETELAKAQAKIQVLEKRIKELEIWNGN